MASYNRVTLLGNVTRDPEVRTIPSGTSVADVGLAINERRKSVSGEWVDETTFVDVTLWGRTAEVAGEYLSKGDPVLIEGRLQLDSWETRDGKKCSKLKVTGERMQLLGGRERSSGTDRQGRSTENEPRHDPAAPAQREAVEALDPNDIPF